MTEIKLFVQKITDGSYSGQSFYDLTIEKKNPCTVQDLKMAMLNDPSKYGLSLATTESEISVFVVNSPDSKPLDGGEVVSPGVWLNVEVAIQGSQHLQEQQQQQQQQQEARFKTPGPQAKLLNNPDPNSPGYILDTFGNYDNPSKKLGALKEFCRQAILEPKDVVALKIPNPNSLLKVPANDLGPFASSVKLPYTGHQLDMRFGFMIEGWDETSVGASLYSLILQMRDEEVPRGSVVLIGKSGCGKTSAIFHAATRVYCLLFTASWTELIGYASRDDPGGFDDSFSRLVSNVSDLATDERLTKDAIVKKSNHLVEAFVVSRMLLLWTFQNQPGGCPLSLLMYQLSDDFHLITISLYTRLSKRETQYLESIGDTLKYHMTGQNNFFLALDEAQHGYDLLKSHGIWRSTRNENEKLGIASSFIHRFLPLKRPIVVAGTALSLGSVDSVKSDVGKDLNLEIFSSFPPVDFNEITHKLKNTLNMDDVDVAQTTLYKLEGRGRLFAGLFPALGKTIKKNPNESKQFLFQKGIKDHYENCLSQISNRIILSFGLEDDSPTNESKLLPKSKKRKRIPPGLDLLATASLLGNPVSRKSIDVDLLHIGLCSVRDVSTDRENTEFLLDEDLGREAVIKVAQDEAFITETFDKATNLCRTNAGNSMEPLIVAELHAWSLRNKNLTVKDFISAAFAGSIPNDLPSWIASAYFCIDGGETKKGYLSRTSRDTLNDVAYIHTAISDPTFQNKLLSPSTVKRPDFEAVMKGNNLSNNLALPSSPISSWFLSISSKCYSKQFDDENGNDLRSTNPNCFYRKADGTENPKCQRLRKMWESTLTENDSIFSRCLRIHFCLPDIVRPGKNPGRIFVDDDNNSIVMYITSSNIRNIFRPDAVEVLQRLGYVWKNDN